MNLWASYVWGRSCLTQGLLPVRILTVGSSLAWITASHAVLFYEVKTTDKTQTVCRRA